MATRKKTAVKPKRSIKEKSKKKVAGKTKQKRAAKVVKKRSVKTVSRAVKHKPVSTKKMPVRERKVFKDLLLKQRAKLSGQVAVLKDESLTRADSVISEEDGTDAFDRQFTLDLVSSEYDLLFEIDEALHRIDDGSYGICQECNKKIQKPRLKALPFVKMCIDCQSKIEQNKAKFYSTSASRRA